MNDPPSNGYYYAVLLLLTPHPVRFKEPSCPFLCCAVDAYLLSSLFQLTNLSSRDRDNQTQLRSYLPIKISFKTSLHRYG